MDETLEKGRELKVVNNGWIKLDSSTNNPINLNNLKNPGNYCIDHWVNGPVLNESAYPLNISVISINDKIHHFVTIPGYTYSRKENDEKKIACTHGSFVALCWYDWCRLCRMDDFQRGCSHR